MRTFVVNGALSLLALSSLIACASTGPSSELVDARRAYDQARMSDAQTYAPDRLLSAKQALDAAEREHADDAGSYEEKSLAYVAARRAELAQSYGSMLKAEADREQTEQRYVSTQERLRKEAEQRASSTERSLENARSDLAQTRTQLTNELASERQARLKAEQQARAAMASLEQIAKVKEESRGMVITLDGAVLFVTGKADLLALAQQKLDQVAQALKDAGEDNTIVVEGHTDSRGADDTNMRLSQQRADVVRNYLVGKGIPADKIRAVGRGEQQPIATNDTPEGRANNRRVEIVVQPRQGGGQSSGTSGTQSGGTWGGTQSGAQPSGTPGSAPAGTQSGTTPSTANQPSGTTTSSGATAPRNTTGTQNR